MIAERLVRFPQPAVMETTPASIPLQSPPTSYLKSTFSLASKTACIQNFWKGAMKPCKWNRKSSSEQKLVIIQQNRTIWYTPSSKNSSTGRGFRGLKVWYTVHTIRSCPNVDQLQLKRLSQHYKFQYEDCNAACALLRLKNPCTVIERASMFVYTYTHVCVTWGIYKHCYLSVCAFIYIYYVSDYSLYHIISNYITLYPIISYRYILHHIILYHILSYYDILQHIISYHIISYHIISYHIIPYYTIS